MNPSPVIALNRAAALSRAEGAAAGLRALEPIAGHPALAHYYLLPATQARLHGELGDTAAAARYYARALECDCSPAERRFLERQACRWEPSA
jgi:RNA polymerase sigma-70 factor (ECF subfamily)